MLVCVLYTIVACIWFIPGYTHREKKINDRYEAKNDLAKPLIYLRVQALEPVPFSFLPLTLTNCNLIIRRHFGYFSINLLFRLLIGLRIKGASV